MLDLLIRESEDLRQEAERTLDRLADTSPDHETMARVLLEMRVTRERLIEANHATKALLRSSRSRIDRSNQKLREVEAVLYSGMIESRP